MDKVLVQLERLKNHHENALATYNDAHLLDLSHILRVWTELVDALPEHYPEFSDKKHFLSAAPTKKLARLIAKDQYVLSYLPCGVETNVNAKEMIEIPKEFSEEAQVGFTVNRVGKPYSYKKFSFVDKSVDRYAPSFIGVENSFLKILDKQKVNRYNFKSWMQTEIGSKGTDLFDSRLSCSSHEKSTWLAPGAKVAVNRLPESCFMVNSTGG